ncbi:MAG: ArsA-related P-loop ATPase, partial [Myxococcota bacterium]|nr:ArsA-related P-loop ATPase [Myxococcota bacterium]
MSCRIIICCGAGGVGKTTCSAALALELARQGARVAALTIDPAKRLADSLGIRATGDPQPVPTSDLNSCQGTLDAMVLDVKQTFDGIVSRYAASPDTAEKILANHYYGFVSTKLPGAHEYMAMERLFQLYTDGDYDFIILDTPPTRNAMDFLTAPRRMAALMDDGVMGALSSQGHAGLRWFTRGSSTAISALSKLVGLNTITDITEFFSLFRDLWRGFKERSLAVDGLLRSDATRFLLVTTPAIAAQDEAEEFMLLLAREKLPIGGVILNRVTPLPTHTEPLAPEDFPDRPAEIPEPTWDAVTQAVAQATSRAQARHANEKATVQRMGTQVSNSPCWHIPLQEEEVR